MTNIRIVLLLSVMLLSACTVNMTQKGFIVQHQEVVAFTQEQLEQWQALLPGYRVTPLSTLTRDNVELKGIYLNHPESEELILFFMGNGMSISAMPQWWLKAMATAGKDIVLFDRRGVGASAGQADIQSLRADAKHKYDFVLESLKPEKIIVHGFSLGSFIAADLTRERKVDKLILQGSATHVEGWIEEVTPWYYQLFVNFEIEPAFFQVNNLNALTTYQGPLLLLAAENDRQAPLSLSEHLYQASGSQPKRLFVVPGANHNNMFKNPDAIEAYRLFLQ